MTRAAGAVDALDARDSRFLDDTRERIERMLDRLRSEAAASAPPELRDVVDYALSTSGKRLRPILCVSAFAAAAPRAPLGSGLFRLACAVEIVHTYSLVHDDLPCMDDDDLRRGRPTVHRAFGVPAATLAGAVLIPFAFAVLDDGASELGLERETRVRLGAELATASGMAGMVGGQLMDLDGEGRGLSGPELERIHRKKTGALLTASLRLGAIAGGAADAVLSSLSRYGSALGLAFQIVDDILDVEGASSHTGKSVGRDLALGKSSYPALHGVEGARALARDRIAEAKAAVDDLGRPELLALADYVIERAT